MWGVCSCPGGGRENFSPLLLNRTCKKCNQVMLYHYDPEEEVQLQKIKLAIFGCGRDNNCLALHKKLPSIHTFDYNREVNPTVIQDLFDKLCDSVEYPTYDLIATEHLPSPMGLVCFKPSIKEHFTEFSLNFCDNIHILLEPKGIIYFDDSAFFYSFLTTVFLGTQVDDVCRRVFQFYFYDNAFIALSKNADIDLVVQSGFISEKKAIEIPRATDIHLANIIHCSKLIELLFSKPRLQGSAGEQDFKWQCAFNLPTEIGPKIKQKSARMLGFEQRCEYNLEILSNFFRRIIEKKYYQSISS